jgi:hypothetical protein
MGLPLVGETLQFFSPEASLDVPRFVRHRLERYAASVWAWAEARLSWNMMGRARAAILNLNLCPVRAQARYGPIFKTSLVGHPVVVSADEELNYMVFQQEGQLFQSWYPDSFVEILGRDNVGEQQGAMFKYLKNMVLRYFGPESLRESSMLRDVEHAVSSSLCTWSTLPAVELKEAVSTVRK